MTSVPSPPAPDVGRDGHKAHRSNTGDPDTGHNNRQCQRQLYFKEHLILRHTDTLGCFQGIMVNVVQAGTGIFEDRKQRIEHNHENGGTGADSEIGYQETQECKAGNGLNHIGTAQNRFSEIFPALDEAVFSVS